ncbi:(heptosyl)LPS beta-1,4-glucosyltransferase [Thermoflavifilum aggregans]|uniref:(Heptosyl)LPS beta-1,4-glucosyltransferase n=1 Tax=Thermoflavifilum aggregans TaxID=454188 RepID=A0A2M9CXX4_9BACT|nr:glycosyltransferase family 2 protein [Thermoflavifilum aggregans]PJJ76762.1 (heptosyl)LPS beta-1,4-glucosyltransferase [Thermoflavifilum aggregans]
MQSISAIVITYNAAAHLQACLQSLLPVASEVLVVDSFSTDQTAEIAQTLPIRFVRHAWQGYGHQKNWAMEQVQHDYVLFIDADEVLSPELQQSILDARQQGLSGCYMLQRLNRYFNRWIYHGLEYPDHKIRLFDRREAAWSTDPVHETVVFKTVVQTHLLNGYLLHYTYQDMHTLWLKIDRYAELGAEKLYQQGKKSSCWQWISHPFATFWKAYLLKAGWKEGTAGLLLAFLAAISVFLKYVRLWLKHHHLN